MRHCITALIAAVIFKVDTAAVAQETYRNPIIEHVEAADPTVIRHEGTYYLYPTYRGRGYDAFVSVDLVHWPFEDRGTLVRGAIDAASPMGPFSKHTGNPIAKRGKGVFGPGHHSVTTGPDGSLWMVYHQKDGEEYSWKRSLAIDALWFDADGVIHVRTTRGTDEPAPGSGGPAR